MEAKKWDCYGIPMKAATPNGYDIIMASKMLGLMEPTKIDSSQQENIKLISDETLWAACEESVTRALKVFEELGVELPVQEYVFSILLANPESPYITMNEGYCGDGGIPGYACGYHLVRHYLRKTGKSIVEATLLPASEILKTAEDFWNE